MGKTLKRKKRRKRTVGMTRTEAAYVRDMKRRSVFDMLETGQARILTPDEYPEPIKRFLARHRNVLHLRLPGRIMRELEARSRRTGVPVQRVARKWIAEGMRRDTA